MELQEHFSGELEEKPVYKKKTPADDIDDLMAEAAYKAVVTAHGYKLNCCQVCYSEHDIK